MGCISIGFFQEIDFADRWLIFSLFEELFLNLDFPQESDYVAKIYS